MINKQQYENAQQQIQQIDLNNQGETLENPNINLNSNDQDYTLNTSENYDKIETIDTFEQMQLSKTLLRGIYGYGYEQPTLIQQKCIPLLLKNIDTIAQAQAGTGKTAGFSIPALHLTDPKAPRVQVLIMEPTHELAKQTFNVINCLGEYMIMEQELKVHLCIGGTKIRDEKQALKTGLQIVVGTPGRVYDMLKCGALDLTYLKLFILDEADDLLNRGFQESIKNIFSFLPGDVPVGLFSATLPESVLELTQQFMRNPASILRKNNEVTSQTVKQFYIPIDKEEYKTPTLKEIYMNIEIEQAIVFANTKKQVGEIAEYMEREGIQVATIHADMDGEQRAEVMKIFKSGQARVLISSDLLCRGIDIHTVNMVINYDLPSGYQARENYIHRIGRTGRHGKTGIAINFVTPSDSKFLIHLEQYYGTKIDELPLDAEEISKIQQ